MRIFGFMFVFLAVPLAGSAQVLKPGFDKAECIELLKVSAQYGDSAYYTAVGLPSRHELLYLSPVMGLENRWGLWANKQRTAVVVNLRGTTEKSVSWLANFYAAMVPAKGELQLSDTRKFPYQLARHPRAAVHVGWLVSMAFLAGDILPKLDSCYRQGVRDVVVMGHSQGGAIACLLTAHLYNQQKLGLFPADIRIKAYCTAVPKPGNLHFAYEYEAMTRGWAYSLVNTADWVPEVPLSVQTVSDFNPTNPFVNAKQIIKKQKPLQRVVLRQVYRQLSRPALKAQRNYQKYLGDVASKTVRKSLNGYVPPEYYNSSHYVRTGQAVVLLADEAYFKTYPESSEKIFTHHYHSAYIELLQRLKE